MLTLDKGAARVDVVVKNDCGGHDPQEEGLCLLELDPARRDREG